MTTETIARRGRVDEQSSDEKARRAVAAFRALQPTLTSYARVLTGNDSVRVDMAARDNGSTDGTRIYFRPPIALGDNTPHERPKCDKRDEDGLQRCMACLIREEILVTIYHEIAHICFDSFAPASMEDRRIAIAFAVKEAKGKWADQIVSRINNAPAHLTRDYMGLMHLINNYLPFLLNCLEDARVNRDLFKSRAGVRHMFEADTSKIFNEGFEAKDENGEIVTRLWKEAPLNSQAMIGVFCKASGYKYDNWFHSDVVNALNDAELTKIVKEMDNIYSAGGVYRLSFLVLARLRELGFCGTPQDPDPEPEPDPEPDESEEDEQERSSDSDSVSGETPDEAESGDDERPEDSEPGSDRSRDGEASEEDGPSDPDQEEEPGDPSDGSSNEEGSDPQDSGPDQGEASGNDEGSDQEPDDNGEDSSVSGEESDSSSSENGSGDGTDDQEGESVDENRNSDDAEGEDESHSDDSDGSPQPSDGSESDNDGESSDADSGSEENGSSDSDGPAGSESDNNSDGESSQDTGPDGRTGDPDSSDSVGDAGLRPEGTEEDADMDSGSVPEPVAPRPEEDSESSGSEEQIDTGADDGYGGTSVETPEPSEPRPPMGTPDEVDPIIKKWGQHEEKPKSIHAQAEEDAVDKALIQGIYFTTPSTKIHGVREHFYGKPIIMEGHNYSLAWGNHSDKTAFKIGASKDGLETPETILQPALLKMRRAFSDNQRGSTQRDRKSGNVNANVLGRRAWANDNRLFQKKTLPGKKDYFVVIGMDISGSTVGRNLALEKKAIMAQATLLTRVGIPFEIIAHTGNYADGRKLDLGLDLDVYFVKEAHENWKDEKVQEHLRTIGPVAANLDGHAMEYLRKRADRSKASHKIIMYYSDGKMPQENHDEELAILRREIHLCKKKQYTLVGVGIRTDSPSRHGLDTVQVDTDEDIFKVIKHLEKYLSVVVGR